ncbi:MAG: histidine triad nucleotide-binding protein [Proteobacteria bacterium]|nr:histidine triad nucleotide-binding protein [Pseudomonadota bacterium]MCH9757983.1 histidine triad nucleotide-binding protein [Pseudomonadota bacterium]
MSYDTNNIFAKVLRGEIPCNKIAENQHALAFYDINPQAPQHALIIPKGAYQSFNEFAAMATADEMSAWLALIADVAKQLGLTDSGYRLLINTGGDAAQEVPHLHAHIVGGHALGRMLATTA